MRPISITNREWAGVLGVLSHHIADPQVTYMFHHNLMKLPPRMRKDVHQYVQNFLKYETEEYMKATEPTLLDWEGLYIVLLVLTGKMGNKYAGVIPNMSVYQDRHSWEIFKTRTHIHRLLDVASAFNVYGILNIDTSKMLRTVKSKLLVELSDSVNDFARQIEGHAQSRT